VDIDENEAMKAFSSKIKATGANLKLVDMANIHLTLKFLGNTRDEHVPRIREILAECARNISPFEIELAGTGAFPSLNRIKVVWVGMRNAEKLGQIASYLEDELSSLGYKREKREFSPHVTIARVKDARNVDYLKRFLKENREEFFGKQKIDRIRLKKSELTPRGPIYSVVEEVLFQEIQ
jgi:2'-5' RNA ligase